MTALIIALDISNEVSLFELVDRVDPKDCILKIGLEAYLQYGESVIGRLIDRNFRIFLDLKFHDIPNTVARACQRCATLGVWMINVHAFGGERMLAAARDALSSYAIRPLLVGVTVLTSMADSDLKSLGVEGSIDQYVNHLSGVCYQQGLDGVVCSALEVPSIKQAYGADFLTVTPGIRLASDHMADQRRVVCPKEASRLGSDYIVVGRPITTAAAPQVVIEQILSDLV